MKYCSNTQKNEAEMLKSLQTTSLCYSNAQTTPKVSVIFNKIEKTKLETFHFVLLLSSSTSSFSSTSFLAKRNSKGIRSLQILNIPYNCLANLLHSYLLWVSCELWVLSYGLKTILKSLRVLVCTLLNFSFNYCVGVARKVRPHLEFWASTGKAARSVRRRFFSFFFSPT